MKTNHTFLASNFNTTLKTAFLSIFLVFLFTENLAAQCKPMIKIDGDNTRIDATDPLGLVLPYWLKENQTLAIGSTVSKISVLEFNVVNGNALEFSRVINITSTSPVTVPVGTVWKIESVAKLSSTSTYHKITFDSPGTYTWSVPACAEEICIDIWGAGGGGGGGSYYNSINRGGGGGGGGAFGSQCFTVTPNTAYTITVGKGGKGGNSGWSNNGVNGTTGTDSKIVDPSSATIISAGGGTGGGGATTSANGTGSAGGTSTASTNASGASGINGDTSMGGDGGAGSNGGAGGVGTNDGGKPGLSPAGGASGGRNNSAGGIGANGKVIISW